MKIETLEVAKINPAVYNPRKDLKPGDAEYEKLKRSILEFDMVEPLVWNKQTGNLVGGHQRLKVLQELGVKTVEVSVVDLPEVKEKALNIALNKISGEWDFPKLKDLLEEIDTGEFDIEVTGFDNEELEKLLANPSKPSTEYQLVSEWLERHEYVVLIFDNSVDWMAAIETLGLEVGTDHAQQRMGGKGLCRVVKGVEVIRRLNENPYPKL